MLAAPLYGAEAADPSTEIVLEVAYDGTAPFDTADALVDGAGAHTPSLDGSNGGFLAVNKSLLPRHTKRQRITHER